MLSRSPSEPIRSYILQLPRQAAECKFGAELDNYLRDRLIAGINDAALQKKDAPGRAANFFIFTDAVREI